MAIQASGLDLSSCLPLPLREGILTPIKVYQLVRNASLNEKKAAKKESLALAEEMFQTIFKTAAAVPIALLALHLLTEKQLKLCALVTGISFLFSPSSTLIAMGGTAYCCGLSVMVHSFVKGHIPIFKSGSAILCAGYFSMEISSLIFNGLADFQFEKTAKSCAEHLVSFLERR
jgi:hypothetical protein